MSTYCFFSCQDRVIGISRASLIPAENNLHCYGFRVSVHGPERTRSMTEIQLPKIMDLLWPTLKALENLGGSASNEELLEEVASILDLRDSALEVPHKTGSRSAIEYRAAWARTRLRNIGAISSTSRAIWTLTEKGRQFRDEKEIREQVRTKRKSQRASRNQPGSNVEPGDEGEVPDDQIWVEDLLDILRGIEPSAFERLCQRVLRESGFAKVEVTGRSGDGGVDGTGVLRINLLSFHVVFQCKRYAGSVGSQEIRNFRGAVSGRADKGLFITTGRFTRDAEREAVRDGALSIDLIDGKDLCKLLKDLGLGVETEPVEVVRPRQEFFESL